jgi:hypothetical protein
LSAKQCASSDEDIEYMSKVPYCSVVGSLMYAMVCSRPDLSYAMSIFFERKPWGNAPRQKIILIKRKKSYREEELTAGPTSG